MYTILVNEDHSLITTNRERIMQRSKCVNSLCFLVKPILNEIDIEHSTVLFEYWTPVSHRYECLTLEVNNNQDGYLSYIIPFDTNLTAEAGLLEVQLTFIYVDMDADGNSIQKSKKTTINKINILPIAAWSDWAPDSALTALDQRIIKQDAQIMALEALANTLEMNMVDDIKYDREEDVIQLQAGENGVGHKISVKEMLDDGVPIVDFSGTVDSDDLPNNGCGCEDDVVEFGYSIIDPNNPSTSQPSDDSDVIEF